MSQITRRSALTLGVYALQAADDGLLRKTLQINDAELKTLEQGLPIVREETTPDKNEVLMYGAVFVNGAPEKFLKTYAAVERMVDGKSYLASKYFRTPPTLADLDSLQFDAADLQQLRQCQPGSCDVQLPAEAMQRIRAGVDWSAPDASRQANEQVRRFALTLLQTYLKNGNAALGVYQDKAAPTTVDQTLRVVLSRAKDLPAYYPAFTNHLLRYPAAKPANTWDFFHWEVVKFGLKPTFRMNHVLFHQPQNRPSAWVVASKQLYSSHYFQTALDLWFCVPGVRFGKSGFYLVTLKGSRQEGLTGFKGRLLRSIAISRTQSSMRNALSRLKEISEK